MNSKVFYQFYFYEIKWMDVIGDSGHASEKEFHNMKPAYMTTNAYLFKKNMYIIRMSFRQIQFTNHFKQI